MAVIDRLAQAASTASTTFDTDKDNRLLVRGFMFDRVTEIGQGNNLISRTATHCMKRACVVVLPLKAVLKDRGPKWATYYETV